MAQQRSTTLLLKPQVAREPGAAAWGWPRRTCAASAPSRGRRPGGCRTWQSRWNTSRPASMCSGCGRRGCPAPTLPQESQPEFPRAVGCTTLINFPLFVRNNIEPHIIIFIFCFIVTTSVLSVGPGHLYSLCGSKFWQRIWLAMIEKNGLCQGIPWQTVTGHHRHHSTVFPVRLRSRCGAARSHPQQGCQQGVRRRHPSLCPGPSVPCLSPRTTPRSLRHSAHHACQFVGLRPGALRPSNEAVSAAQGPNPFRVPFPAPARPQRRRAATPSNARSRRSSTSTAAGPPPLSPVPLVDDSRVGLPSLPAVPRPFCPGASMFSESPKQMPFLQMPVISEMGGLVKAW